MRKPKLNTIVQQEDDLAEWRKTEIDDFQQIFLLASTEIKHNGYIYRSNS